MQNKKKKKQSFVLLETLLISVFIMLLSILFMWLLNREPSDPNPSDQTSNVSSDDTTTSNTTLSLSVETINELNGYLTDFYSTKTIRVFHNDLSVDLDPLLSHAPIDNDSFKEWVIKKGYTPELVDLYLSSRIVEPLDTDYISAKLYELNDLIHQSYVQGYVVEEDSLKLYRSDFILSVDIPNMTSLIETNLKIFDYSSLDAVTVTQAFEEPDWDEIYQRVHVEPQDAHYVYNEQTKLSDLIPETIGKEIDIESLKTKFHSSKNEFVTEAIILVYPEITLENIEQEMFPDLLVTYQSWYNANEKNRTNNLLLAAKAVDGTVVLPGERFSFNTVVGERTEERGYLPATIYTRNGMKDGLGGGICQVSSTIYCCVLFSDMKVVERWNHGYTVSYVDLGRDATVSYGSLDFRFENSFDNPIIIRTTTENGVLTVSFYGIKTKEISVVIKNLKVETMKPEIKTKVDPTLGKNDYVIQSKGKNGYVVETYKTVAINGQYVSQDVLITKDVYAAYNGEALVGTEWGITEDTTSNSSEMTSAVSSSDTSASEPPVSESSSTYTEATTTGSSAVTTTENKPIETTEPTSLESEDTPNESQNTSASDEEPDPDVD